GAAAFARGAATNTSVVAKAGCPADGLSVPGTVERLPGDTGSRRDPRYQPGRSNAPVVLHDRAAFYERRLNDVFLSDMVRRMSRWASAFFSAWRLSCCCLPW